MQRHLSSKTDSQSLQSGSAPRVYRITEASSVLPSLSVSAFSLDVGNECQSQAPSGLLPHDLIRSKANFDEGLSSSCKDGLDVFDNPDYTDTVRSTDSSNSILRRSMSVPPQYMYKQSVRKHAQEVFEDFISRDTPDDDDGDAEPVEGPKEETTQWRQTMEDLLERPDYTDSLQSTSSGTALLAKTAIKITKEGQKAVEVLAEQTEQDIKKKKAQYIKNLLVLSLSFFFVFAAYISLRNLQSSINDKDGLAMYSLSALYLCFCLGCIFAPTIIQFLRPKNTIVLGQSGFLIYFAANFYPTYYTLLPVSALVGFSLSNIWTAHSTYLTSIALNYAEVSGKSLVSVLTKFNGLFFMFFGISQVLGGIVSSTVLSPSPKEHARYDDGNLTYQGILEVNNSQYNLIINGSTYLSTSDAEARALKYCGVNFCHGNNQVSSTSDGEISKDVIYLLLGIYSLLIVIGILVLVFFLDKLDGVMQRSHRSVIRQLSAVFRWFVDFRVVCLLGLMVYSLVQMSFMFGEFTKAFVTCPIGVHMVGYAMLSLSVAASMSSYVTGKLVKCTGRLPQILGAGVLHFILLMVMLVWKPTSDSLPVLLVFTSAWGIADGIWLTQVVSLFGVTFTENREAAFAGLKMCQALGACVNFVTAEYLCYRMKVYLISVLLVVAMAGYVTLELYLKRQERKNKDNNNTPKGQGPTAV